MIPKLWLTVRCPLPIILIALIWLSLTSCSLGQQPDIADCFYCIDVSGSMTGVGSNNISIFQDAKDKLVEDIRGRSLGSHVDLTSFGGPPRQLVARTLQSEDDKDFVVSHLDGLEARAGSTYLYLTYFRTLERGLEWARKNPDHIVEVRLYTDGVNENAPPRPNLADLTNLCAVGFGEIDNLMMSVIRFEQPGMTTAQKQEQAREDEALGRWRRRFSWHDKIVRVSPSHLELGNIRASGYEKQFNLVTYFPANARGEELYLEPVLSDRQHLLNVFPRPIAVTDQAILQTLKVVDVAAIENDNITEFRGAFHLRSKASHLKFTPPSIEFSFSTRELRTATIFIENAVDARRHGDEVWVALGPNRVYADRGLSPVDIEMTVVDTAKLRPSDTLDLTVQIPDPELKGKPVLGFCSSPTSEESPTLQEVITSGSKRFYLRADYSSGNLQHIVADGHYATGIQVSGPEGTAVMIGVRNSKDVSASPTRVLRIFPGPLPDAGHYPCPVDTPVLQPCILMPPPGWIRWLVAGISALLLAAAGRFLLAMPRSTTMVFAISWLLLAGALGAWYGILPFPTRFHLGWIWLTLFVIHGLFPLPFACLPVTGGWVMTNQSSGRPYRLRSIAMQSGKRGLNRFLARNRLNEREILRTPGDPTFVIECNPINPRKLFLRAIGSGVSVFQDGLPEPLDPPRKVKARSNFSFEVAGTVYVLHFRLVRSRK